MGKFFAIVDMGTTNTRLSLVDDSGKEHGSVKGGFGVRDRAATGSREILTKGLNQLLRKVAHREGIALRQIEYMLCSGMITSEIGLIDIPHCIAPVDVHDLARNAREISMPEILPAPIILIPGVRNRVAQPSLDTLEEMDFMRGEETQVFGAIELYGVQVPVTFMFLSSHTKLVDVDEKHRITRSFTTLSGQIFNAFRFQTLLASSIPEKDPADLDEEGLFRGVRAGLKGGILRAALMVRFMDTLIRTSPSERFAFLEGVIIASDVQAIKNSYPLMRKRVAVLGDRLRSEAYRVAFKTFLDPSLECIYLGEQSMDQAARHGALRITNLRSQSPSTR
jgi:2-dehydro-3-deoxygalactonokinase